MAWQAQLRLCRRYNRLMHKGKHREVVLPKVDVKLRMLRMPA